ncbi:hypothetical protein JCM8097_008231 [Rhodosporidiobolus ruineniae]
MRLLRFRAPPLAPVQPVTGPQGVEWKPRKVAALVVLVASSLLLVWLVSAVLLWRLEVTLPVDFFGGVGPDEDRAWSNGQYNTLVSVVGSFIAAWVGYGLKHSLGAVLRRRLLRPQGISLAAYDTVSNLAQRQLLWKWSGSAVLAALLFLLAELLLDPATQAAFGTSVVQTNLSIPFRRARLADNLELLLPFLDNVTSLLSASDEADVNVDAVAASLSAVPQTVQATILNTLEASSANDPLFAAQTQLRIIQGVLLPEVENNLTRRETRMLEPSREIVAFAEVEGFLAESSCTLFSPNYTTAPSPSLKATAFSINFPCGQKQVYYWTSPASRSPSTLSPNYTVADAFACPDGTEVVFLYTAAPSPPSPALVSTYRCAISATSVLVPMAFSPLLDVARFQGPWTDPVPLPASLGIVDLLGEDLLDDMGPRGFVVLQRAWQQVDERGQDVQEFLERTVETLVKVTLARASYVFTRAAEEGAVDALRYEDTESKYQVEALALHLTNDTLYWLLPPLLLLALLLFTGSHVLLPQLGARTLGRTDFTDPLECALIALGSPEDERVRGAGTGEFADEEAAREREVRLRYGERARKVGEPDEGSRRLVLTAARQEELRLNKPETGVAYV